MDMAAILPTSGSTWSSGAVSSLDQGYRPGLETLIEAIEYCGENQDASTDDPDGGTCHATGMIGGASESSILSLVMSPETK